MEKIKKIVKSTTGKKTTTSVVLLLLYEAFKIWKPDVLNASTDKVIMLTINSGLVVGLLHKVWRTYTPKIYKYIKAKIKSLKTT